MVIQASEYDEGKTAVGDLQSPLSWLSGLPERKRTVRRECQGGLLGNVM